MSNTRFIIVIAVLTILVVTFAVSYSIIGAFASNSVSKPERATLPIADEAGRKIYQQSEWADYQRARSSSNKEGLAIYHESEHKSASVGSAVYNEEGLAIYLESEWADYQRARSNSNKEGLAIYHESEHKSASVESAVYNEEGLAIYLESERYGVEALPVRLYNGKPFNAYQRSEWLGAER